MIERVDVVLVAADDDEDGRMLLLMMATGIFDNVAAFVVFHFSFPLPSTAFVVFKVYLRNEKHIIYSCKQKVFFS